VHAVVDGSVIFGPALAARIAAYFTSRPQGISRGAASFPELTTPEREVRTMVVKGRSNHAIAAEPVVSEKMVP
jgi:DNA-binding NarL/FixJ family response regulator